MIEDDFFRWAQDPIPGRQDCGTFKYRNVLEMEILDIQILNTKNFPEVYKALTGLRFPIQVADVLEFRAVLNEAVDHYDEPELTPAYREFSEALHSAINSFGVESRHHSERLLKLLSLLRSLHYRHSLNSRDTEVQCRERLEASRAAHQRSFKLGVFTIVAGLTAGVVWFMFPEISWAIKLITLGSAYLSWNYFHSLPILEREIKELNAELNDVLRRRIKTVDWKLLIHKMSLLMGYKKVAGVEVFNLEHEKSNRGQNYHFN